MYTRFNVTEAKFRLAVLFPLSVSFCKCSTFLTATPIRRTSCRIQQTWKQSGAVWDIGEYRTGAERTAAVHHVTCCNACHNVLLNRTIISGSWRAVISAALGCNKRISNLLVICQRLPVSALGFVLGCRWQPVNGYCWLRRHFPILRVRLLSKLLTFSRRNYFFFLILAHRVYKMWIIQEPNTLELWNKLQCG